MNAPEAVWWAEWFVTKVPRFRIWKFKGIGSDRYWFELRGSSIMVGYSDVELREMYARGAFKPFVYKGGRT